MRTEQIEATLGQLPSNMRSRKLRKLLVQIPIILAIASIAGFAGYYLGSKKASYQHHRWEIFVASTRNTLLDKKDYDRSYRDNDTLVLNNYFKIQTYPKWLIPFFTSGEERDSDEGVAIIADRIEKSLKRSNLSESRSKIEEVARDCLAFHRTISASTVHADDSKNY